MTQTREKEDREWKKGIFKELKAQKINAKLYYITVSNKDIEGMRRLSGPREIIHRLFIRQFDSSRVKLASWSQKTAINDGPVKPGRYAIWVSEN